jgi:hypothetical protein
MSNALYDKGRNKFARGDFKWLAAGGDTIRCMLADAAGYTPDTANDEFFSDVPATARVGNSGGDTRADMPQLTLIDPADGVCDANDITFTSVPTGGALEYLIIFKDDGAADTTSPLIAIIDTATGLPVTPNNGDINVAWDSGANKIFKL